MNRGTAVWTKEGLGSAAKLINNESISDNSRVKTKSNIITHPHPLTYTCPHTHTHKT